MNRTIVYIKLEEDSVACRETNKGFSGALMWLGEFTEEQEKNGEDLEVYGQHLYENDDWCDQNMHEIMDRGQYSSLEEDAWDNALQLAKSSGFHVVNPKFNT